MSSGSTMALCLFASGNAQAINIIVDPGTVGSSFQDQIIPFNDLNDTNLNGQVLDVDFLFDDMKHLELNFNDFSPTEFFYNVRLTLFHNAGTLDPLPPFPTGFLSDENGNSIAMTESVLVGQVPIGSVNYELSFNENSVDNLIHHDIHFDITLPNVAGMVTGGQLELGITSPTGAITVGEWEPIPEPSTVFGLLTISGIGLGLKKKKQS
ncbi:MAG: PEP-CTERM sorting domain-containing protein [Crocosphaera sp.]